MNRPPIYCLLALLISPFAYVLPTLAQYYVQPLAVNGSFGNIDGNAVAVDSVGNVYMTGTYPDGGKKPAVFEVREGLLSFGQPRIVLVAGSNVGSDPWGSQLCSGKYHPNEVGLGNTNQGGLAVDNSGGVYITQGDPAVLRVSGGWLTDPFNWQNCLTMAPTNSSGTGVAVDNSGNVFFATGMNAGAVYKVSLGGGTTTLMSGGATPCASGVLGKALGLAVDLSDNVYVADEYCNVIWKVPPSGSPVAFAGIPGNSNGGCIDGTATSATLYGPTGVAVDWDYNIYIADTCGIRMVVNNDLSTIATPATLGSSGLAPVSVAVDHGEDVYVGLTGEIVLLGPPGATIYSPFGGSVLPGTSVNFEWYSAGANAEYQLDVSDRINTIGQGDIYAGPPTGNLSQVINNIPCDGRPIYVQLRTNGFNPARRYNYTACQMLSLTASPTTLSSAGGTVTLTAKVVDLSNAGQTVNLVIDENFPPICRPVCIGRSCFTICQPVPAVILGSETQLKLTPNSPDTYSVIVGIGALPAGASLRTLNFSAVVTDLAGNKLDTVSLNVTQN